MPTHPFFGDYETTSDDSSCDFNPVMVNGTEVELMLLEIGPQVTPELIDKFASFCENLETHIKTVRAIIREAHVDLVVPFVDDLVESNPGMDILSELFPDEKNLVSVAQLTPKMVARATAVTACMANTDPEDPDVTVDLTFKADSIDYLFANRFGFDGMYLETDVES